MISRLTEFLDESLWGLAKSGPAGEILTLTAYGCLTFAAIAACVTVLVLASAVPMAFG